MGEELISLDTMHREKVEALSTFYEHWQFSVT